ncbi:unnamed protein product [Protopolystoma xenopodis]|uniref:Uncharacterized protein n=1 Tax=Protopolystoma xenopodis TaxID=117903 RepID=A0A3S5B4B0_9PLAT|nr:unnamed protein product [Protopolystoma xenopodis]
MSWLIIFTKAEMVNTKKCIFEKNTCWTQRAAKNRYTGRVSGYRRGMYNGDTPIPPGDMSIEACNELIRGFPGAAMQTHSLSAGQAARRMHQD